MFVCAAFIAHKMLYSSFLSLFPFCKMSMLMGHTHILLVGLHCMHLWSKLQQAQVMNAFHSAQGWLKQEKIRNCDFAWHSGRISELFFRIY